MSQSESERVGGGEMENTFDIETLATISRAAKRKESMTSRALAIGPAVYFVAIASSEKLPRDGSLAYEALYSPDVSVLFRARSAMIARGREEGNSLGSPPGWETLNVSSVSSYV